LDIEVSDAWIRRLPAGIPAAGYLTMVNRATVNRILVAVTSPAFGEVSIHQSVEDHGMSTMRPVDSVTLAPRVPFRFEEGGYHLMLMQPRSAIHPGDRVTMTFHFKDAPSIDAVFAVRGSG
jgi:copper(I)-binding protein